MTKREQVAVVELLRCAADVSSLTAAGYATNHCDGVYPCTKVYLRASEAYAASPGILFAGGYHSYPHACLEAAARVELGEWP